MKCEIQRVFRGKSNFFFITQLSILVKYLREHSEWQLIESNIFQQFSLTILQVYWVGPCLGGAVASLIYNFLLAAPEAGEYTPVNVEEKEVSKVNINRYPC